MEADVHGSSPLSKDSKSGLGSLKPSKKSLESPNSIPKSGLGSLTLPSTKRLESPNSILKSRLASLNSPSKTGLENVNQPWKKVPESLDSPSKSDPVNPGEIAHSSTSEIEVTVLIYNGQAHQRTCHVKIDRDATILELTQSIQEQTEIPLYQLRLFSDGSGLRNKWDGEEKLSACNINDKTVMTMVLGDPTDGQSDLATSTNATTHVQAKNEVQATSNDYDYDEDLYIIDPQAHFDMLKQLERKVLQRSEYFQTKREYSLSSALDPVDDDGFFLDQIGLRASLTKKIRRSSIVTRTLQEKDPSSGTFWHLLKSYSIILNASRSLKQMVSLRFCTDAINVLVFRDRVEVIEIRRVPLEMIMDIEKGLEAALGQVLETDLEEYLFTLNVTNMVMTPCRRLLEHVGSHFLPLAHTLNELSTIVRGVALLIDVGLVSYVRSHGSGFDDSYFSDDLSQLEVQYGDELVFGCYWARLACLNSFLDRKKVWVFDFSHPDRRFDDFPGRRKDRKLCSKPLLARMEDLADIWGPIYTVPTSTGLVKYYGVSKGVIYRVKSKKESRIPGAILCHYSRRLLFVKNKLSRLLTDHDYLTLSPNDLLLIGAGFRENKNCRYTMSAFAKESATAMAVLGTKDSVWRTDSRGLAVGLSKYLGVTISGTQKLIPQTTLKQHILDNPQPEDIVNVWKDYASNRSDIAELVCCTLEVLDSTGWNEQKVFNSAVLIDNDEWAVPVPSSLNSWLVALKDTHLTSAYVITNEICLECEVPDHTTSTCETFQAFTALKTQITTAESPLATKAEYLLKPFGERLRQTECGSSAVVLLTPNLRTFPNISFRTKVYECSELLNRTKPDCFRSTVYLRASTRSYRGRYEVKDSILAKFSFGLRQNRHMPAIDRSSGTDEPVSEKPGKQNQPKEVPEQHVGPQLPRRRRAQVPPGLVQSSEGQHIIGVSTVLTPRNGRVIAHAGKQPVQKEAYNARPPAAWPMRPRTIRSDASQEITNSDVHGQDMYDFGPHQTDSHLPGKPIGVLNIRGSSQSAPEAGPSPVARPLWDNLANYAFSDEDDSDSDHMITTQRHELPAGYSPGGWV
ncbi:MAG: hypothetical protein Q9199_004800 [Rusavskia elegans]